MKVLYVTTIGITMGFFKSFIKQLVEEGHQVDIACNETVSAVPDCYREWGCSVYPISCSRSPLNKGNLTAIRQLRSIVKEGGYELVHCHTPIAAMCTRLACRPLRKRGVKVFYTAHGFHFYKGAPLKNWLLYYPAEKLCSYFTDVLITMNQEDYSLALKKMKAKRVEYVPGVGIDTQRFMLSEEERAEKRKIIRQRHGIPETAKLLLSVGEVNENKNHGVVIEALSKLDLEDVYYIICGQGPMMDERKALAQKLGLEERVIFAGYRNDVPDYYQAADIFVFPSFREGLPVSVMEAMASGLPVVCSNIRGCTDLVEDRTNGFVVNKGDVHSLSVAIDCLLEDESLCSKFGEVGEKLTIGFCTEIIIEKMKELYNSSL